MKASVADAAGKEASSNGAACDTDVPIYFCVVTQGRCRRVLRLSVFDSPRTQCPTPISPIATVCKSVVKSSTPGKRLSLFGSNKCSLL